MDAMAIWRFAVCLVDWLPSRASAAFDSDDNPLGDSAEEDDPAIGTSARPSTLLSNDMETSFTLLFSEPERSHFRFFNPPKPIQRKKFGIATALSWRTENRIAAGLD